MEAWLLDSWPGRCTCRRGRVEGGIWEEAVVVVLAGPDVLLTTSRCPFRDPRELAQVCFRFRGRLLPAWAEPTERRVRNALVRLIGRITGAGD